MQKGWSEGAECRWCKFQGSELVRVHPLVGTLILEAHSLHQLICLCGAAAAIYIGDGLGLFSINLVQQGCEDTPGFPEFITTDKVHLAPTEDIQDEAFIGIRELHILVSVAIS